MPTVLIVDDNKSSVVMTSEIIKDHIPGVVVEVVGSGADCLSRLKTKPFDLVVADFDLPDADGVSLAKVIRVSHNGPILLTAFDDEVVRDAINVEMFAYADIGSWVKKPIVTEDFVSKLDKFLLKKERISKRFATDIPTEISGKTKKNPIVKGRVINLSITGAGLTVSAPLKAKIGDQVSLTLDFHRTQKKKDSAKGSEKEVLKTKIEAELVWVDKTKKKAGFKFNQLDESLRKDLEDVMRSATEIT